MMNARENYRIFKAMRRETLAAEEHLDNLAAKKDRVSGETVEQFLARGGKITKIQNTSYNYYRLNRYSVVC